MTTAKTTDQWKIPLLLRFYVTDAEIEGAVENEFDSMFAHGTRGRIDALCRTGDGRRRHTSKEARTYFAETIVLSK